MAPQLYFSLFLALSLILVSWAEVISLRSTNDSPQPNNLLVPKAPEPLRGLRRPRQAFNSPGSLSTHDRDDDLDLVDIILIASVDGKFHALNRTTGQTLWSMSSFPSSASVSAPSTLGPLVRTVHPSLDINGSQDIDDEDEDGDGPRSRELYIIEPQSGDIYIMNPATPSVPMQRFPFSMAELVDMSPFDFVPAALENDDDVEGGEAAEKKIFVGRKETSLLLIELETGKIKATLNSECAWDDDEAIWDDIRRRNNNRARRGDDDEEDGDGEEERKYSYEGMIDLDELDGTKPPIEKPTEVYIGRTDYHISIHTRYSPYFPDGSLRPRRRAPPPAQNLSFSVYGPNNKDNQLQAGYRRTKDGKYIQSLPNGEVIAFRTKNGRTNSNPAEFEQPIIWAQNFENPIVAVFDVLRKPAPASPSFPHQSRGKSALVLLQPRASLENLLPNVTPSTRFPNSDAAYVGMVRETGSLFAMSPGKFPLVSFGGNGLLGASTSQSQHSGDAGPEDPYLKEVGFRDAENDVGGPPSVDDITAARKHQERVSEVVKWNRDKEAYCNAVIGRDGKRTRGESDRRCLIGVRKVESEEVGNGRDSRMRRLIDAPKDMKASPQTESNELGSQAEVQTTTAGPDGNLSQKPTSHPEHKWNPRDSPITTQLQNPHKNGRWWWIMVLVASVVVGAVGVWSVVGARWLYWWKVESTQEAQQIVEASQNGHIGGTKSVSFLETTGDSSVEGSVSEVPNEATEPIAEDYVVVGPHKESPPPLTTTKTPTATPAPAPMQPNSPAPNADSPRDQAEDSDGGEDGPASGETPTTPRKKTRRGKRGKKKKPGQLNGNLLDGEGDDEKTPVNGEAGEDGTPASSTMVINTPKQPASAPSLIVSETVLGFGSHGTVVYKGSLQGRAVAVKRLLMDFTTLAQREVSILQESDDHPNVIRYYYQESHSNFLYIALELCPASLADIVENPDRDEWRDIAVAFDPKRALSQITSGLRHLHALKLVHRDIKPQNILVSSAKTGHGRGSGAGGGYRMLISDFGLCKKLETDQTSFLPTANGVMGAGTVGWRAPEILRGEVKLDDLLSGPGSDDHSLSSRGSTSTVTSGSTPTSGKGTRLTKSVDIFALGCLFYYVLTNGGHPFGDRYEREVNILKGAKNLDALQRFGEEGAEAVNLIEQMLDSEASERPDTTTTLLHPYFWSPLRRLTFLQDASDRFEIMCRDPRDPLLIILEKGAKGVVGDDWLARLDKLFIENLGKFRKYDPKSVQDLLRALRNKKHHYQDMPDPLKRNLGPMPEGFLAYFTKRFPKLFMHVHGVVKDTSLSTESMFRNYFELTES